MSRRPMTYDDLPEPESFLTQWQREADRLRTIVEARTRAELELLNIFVEKQRRFVHGRPEIPLDPRAIDCLKDEIERHNDEGLRLYRLGHADYGAFASIATPADVARHDNDFQKLLGHVVAGTVNRVQKED